MRRVKLFIGPTCICYAAQKPILYLLVYETIHKARKSLEVLDRFRSDYKTVFSILTALRTPHIVSIPITVKLP